MGHDAAASLPLIQTPTLVIGGWKDQSVGGDASVSIAAAIPNAKLRMYDELGHGLYDEAKDFQPIVLTFLRGELS